MMYTFAFKFNVVFILPCVEIVYFRSFSSFLSLYRNIYEGNKSPGLSKPGRPITLGDGDARVHGHLQ